MTITSQNIKLLKSERLTDYQDGGGSVTGDEVIDGLSNDIFPDVSELDRSNGRVGLRKLFMAVDSENTDYLLGGTAIVAEGAEDPNVLITMFSTKDWTDTRSGAENAMESYLSVGTNTSFRLFDDHIAGQKTIAMMAPDGTPPPKTNDVYVMIHNQGEASEVSQFVRVSSVSTIELTYETQSCGKFKIRKFDCTITEKLGFAYLGEQPDCDMTKSPLTQIRTSVVADATNYYSVTDLAADASIGDKEIDVADIYTKLVPSTQEESPVADYPAGGELGFIVPCGNTQTYKVAIPVKANAEVIHVGMPIVRTSLAIPSLGLIDLGDGRLVLSADTSIEVAEIDYREGSYRPTDDWLDIWYGTTVDHIMIAGYYSIQLVESQEIKITEATRALNYAPVINPLPQRGTLRVLYMVAGDWYELRDLGNGQVKGDSSDFGAGTLNFDTGSLVVTLGELPDVGSSIILQWATAMNFYDAPVVDENIGFNKEIDTGNIVLGTLVASWDGKSVTPADDVISGGDASGFIVGKSVHLIPSVTPSKGSVYNLAFDAGGILEQEVTDTNNTTFTLVNPIDDTIRVSAESVGKDYNYKLNAGNDGLDYIGCSQGNQFANHSTPTGAYNPTTKELSVTMPVTSNLDYDVSPQWVWGFY